MGNNSTKLPRTPLKLRSAGSHRLLVSVGEVWFSSGQLQPSDRVVRALPRVDTPAVYSSEDKKKCIPISRSFPTPEPELLPAD